MTTTPVTVLVPDRLLPFLQRASGGDIGAYLCRLASEAQGEARAGRVQDMLLAGLDSESEPFDIEFAERLAARVTHTLAQT